MSAVFLPEVFQGRGRKPPYFEGWYYRADTADGRRSFAFIPGISLSREDSHAFLQVLDSQSHRTKYFRFPPESFIASSRVLDVALEKSRFTKNGFEVDCGEFAARCRFSRCTQFPRSLWSPGIMGPFSFVPGLPCRHGVVIVKGEADGFVLADGEPVDLTGGSVYVEKDWGTSFPRSYLWVQANRFSHTEASFLLSVADIPVFGGFVGMIGFLHQNGKLHRFATYQGASVQSVSEENGEIAVAAQSLSCLLRVRVRYGEGGILKAPEQGAMDRKIFECVNADLRVELLSKTGKVLFSGHSDFACVEASGKLERLAKEVRIRPK